MNQRTSVGLDVHARSVVACGLDGETGELFERRLTPDRQEILGWICTLPRAGVGDLRGWADRVRVGAVPAWRRGSSVWSRRRRSCSAPPVTESRPMRETLGIWLVCFISVRSWR